MKFEDAWIANKKVTARVFDENSNSSKKIISDCSDEYYTRDQLGEYSFILDPSKKYRKVKQKAQYGDKEAFGQKKANYVYIRDNFWSLNNDKYNKNPSIFYLDIETSVNSYIYDNIEVEVRKRESDES